MLRRADTYMGGRRDEGGSPPPLEVECWVDNLSWTLVSRETRYVEVKELTQLTRRRMVLLLLASRHRR